MSISKTHTHTHTSTNTHIFTSYSKTNLLYLRGGERDSTEEEDEEEEERMIVDIEDTHILLPTTSFRKLQRERKNISLVVLVALVGICLMVFSRC